MFENPHMIYEIAKQKHRELLAEAEYIHKINASPNIIMKKNRRLGKIMLMIADLFIAIGVGLNRKFGAMPEASEDAGNDNVAP